MKPTKRLFIIRHLSRDKKMVTDPQTPTMIGFVEAFVMGLILATKFGVTNFIRIVSSPQPRCTRTAQIMQYVVSIFINKGDGLGQMAPVETDCRLNDFSSDPAFKELKPEFQKIKNAGGAIESEQAIMMAAPDSDLEKLRVYKADMAMACIDEIISNAEEGDNLIGVHGATIDEIASRYKATVVDGMPAHGMNGIGRQLEHCEGFVLTINGDNLMIKKFELIERPSWLNALTCLL